MMSIVIEHHNTIKSVYIHILCIYLCENVEHHNRLIGLEDQLTLMMNMLEAGIFKNHVELNKLDKTFCKERLAEFN